MHGVPPVWDRPLRERGKKIPALCVRCVAHPAALLSHPLCVPDPPPAALLHSAPARRLLHPLHQLGPTPAAARPEVHRTGPIPRAEQAQGQAHPDRRAHHVPDPPRGEGRARPPIAVQALADPAADVRRRRAPPQPILPLRARVHPPPCHPRRGPARGNGDVLHRHAVVDCQWHAAGLHQQGARAPCGPICKSHARPDILCPPISRAPVQDTAKIVRRYIDSGRGILQGARAPESPVHPLRVDPVALGPVHADHDALRGEVHVPPAR